MGRSADRREGESGGCLENVGDSFCDFFYIGFGLSVGPLRLWPMVSE